MLCGILDDRRNRADNRPTAEDQVHALCLLSEHFRAGLAPENVLDHIRTVCTEAREPVVRRAAYAALANARPTPNVTALLLKRQSEGTPAAEPAVSAALCAIAEKLEERAADPGASDRADAVVELARIDPGRAAVYARALLTAEPAADRMTAAKIIGQCGNEDDADALEAATANEPNVDVRNELGRAIRRVRVGDSVAAHELIGELAHVEDPDAWLALAPAKLYGEWADALVEGLGRVTQSESKQEFGTAIDQLSEIARALLFRAIDIAGDQIAFSPEDRVKAAKSDLDYGSVLSRQQLNQNWKWVSHFASLHQLRTEHIVKRRTMDVPPQRTADDLKTAYVLFGLGARPCCELLLQAVARS